MKKIATGKQISMVVYRALPIWLREMPEGKLWFAVIERALCDSDLIAPSFHKPSRNFLTSDSFMLICEVLDLDLDFVMELVGNHASWMRPAR